MDRPVLTLLLTAMCVLLGCGISPGTSEVVNRDGFGTSPGIIWPGATLQVSGQPAEDTSLVADIVRVMDNEMECERVRE